MREQTRNVLTLAVLLFSFSLIMRSLFRTPVACSQPVACPQLLYPEVNNHRTTSAHSKPFEEFENGVLQELKRNRRDPRACQRYGFVLMSRQKSEAARHWYRLALDLNPQEPNCHLGLAMVDLQEGRRAEALVEGQKELSVNPDSAGARDLLGLPQPPPVPVCSR
jgi:tetratricopeptide (TPR) repeat protein